jgi:hypothetical protein
LVDPGRLQPRGSGLRPRQRGRFPPGSPSTQSTIYKGGAFRDRKNLRVLQDMQSAGCEFNITPLGMPGVSEPPHAGQPRIRALKACAWNLGRVSRSQLSLREASAASCNGFAKARTLPVLFPAGLFGSNEAAHASFRSPSHRRI